MIDILIGIAVTTFFLGTYAITLLSGNLIVICFSSVLLLPWIFLCIELLYIDMRKQNDK